MRNHGMRVLALIAACVLQVGCDMRPEPVLRVGTNIWPGYEPLYLARSLDYFSAEDVRLVEFTSTTQVIRAFRNHAIDAATLTLDETLQIAQDIPDIRIVTVMDVSSGADVILAQPGIADLRQLRGKRVGVEQSALGGFVLSRALQRADMADADVQRIYLQVDEHEQAFTRGDVDAVVTFEPVRGKLLAHGASLVFDSTQIPGEIMDVLVVHRDFLTHHSGQVQKVVDAWFRSLAFMEDKPGAAAQLMAPRLHVEPQALLDAYRLIDIPRYAENVDWLAEPNRRIVVSAQRLANFMHQSGLLRKPVAVESLPDEQPLRAIAPIATETLR